MRDYIPLSSVPIDEEGTPISSETDYIPEQRRQCQIYKEQLERQFPEPPGNCYFAVKSFPHDFGTYYEVVVYYSTKSQVEIDFAVDCENNLPENWDEQAKFDLAHNGPMDPRVKAILNGEGALSIGAVVQFKRNS